MVYRKGERTNRNREAAWACAVDIPVPRRLAEFLRDAIRHDHNRNPWKGFPDLEVDFDSTEKELHWLDKSFYHREKDWKNEYGPFFGVSPFAEGAVIDADNANDGPILYLYFSRGHNRRKAALSSEAAVRKAIEVGKGSITISNLSFRAFEGDNFVLAHQSMGDLINLDNLRNDERSHMIEQFVERAREFSAAFAPLLPQVL
jgi:hypothetical protein